MYADVGESDYHNVISSQRGTTSGNMERKKLLISENEETGHFFWTSQDLVRLTAISYNSETLGHFCSFYFLQHLSQIHSSNILS